MCWLACETVCAYVFAWVCACAVWFLLVYLVFMVLLWPHTRAPGPAVVRTCCSG